MSVSELCKTRQDSQIPNGRAWIAEVWALSSEGLATSPVSRQNKDVAYFYFPVEKSVSDCYVPKGFLDAFLNYDFLKYK